MAGPADRPDGLVADETAVAAAEEMTLGEVLQIAETPQTILQDFVEATLRATSEPTPGLTQVIVSDPIATVQSIFFSDVGRGVGHSPMWLRLWRPDLSRSLLVALHSPNPYGEVDLLMIAHPGVLNRATLRALFRWCFFAGGWSRVVARVPPEPGPPRKGSLADLLRRGGFKFEGVARCGLLNGDAHIWALTPRDALWVLPRSQRQSVAPALADIPPPSSLKVH